MRIDKEKSNLIYTVKALAIFSVVCAHCTSLNEEQSTLSMYLNQFLNYLGTFGVPVLFVISGFFFYKNEKGFLAFWKNKLLTIIVPWVFCETFLWLYVVIRKGGISFYNWFLFLIGYNHTTYYLTVLIFFFLLFWFIKDTPIIIAFMILGGVTLVSTGWNLPLSILNNVFGTAYLNPFNWMFYFSAGMLMAKKEKYFVKVIPVIRKLVGVLIVGSIAILAVFVYTKCDILYFSRWGLISALVNGCMILSLSAQVNQLSLEKIKSVFIYLGKISFTIYLLHQFFAGIVVRISDIANFELLIVFRPFVVIGLTALVIWGLIKIGKGLPFIKLLVGVR